MVIVKFKEIDIERYASKCTSCNEGKQELFLSRQTAVCMKCFKEGLAAVTQHLRKGKQDE